MKTAIFSKKGVALLQDNMNICLNDVGKKILFDAPKHISFFRNLIDFMADLKPPHTFGEIGSSNNDKNQNYLNNKLEEFSKIYIKEEDSDVYEIYDNLRHAFVIYKEFGVYGIYKNREAESWYPKVIIRNDIGSRDFLTKLDSQVVIYRGTSNTEYESGKFSQSWTTCKDIAYKFAFIHYEGQANYQDTLRVLLKAKIDKRFIYFYNEDDDEKEVIIDERKIPINTIEVCEKRTIT